jgi:hypothetical protein
MKDKDCEKGLYRKYSVKRLGDKAGKHKDCTYYVLDLDHDRFAIPALKAYVKACKKEYPDLAKDLKKQITFLELKWSKTFLADTFNSVR